MNIKDNPIAILLVEDDTITAMIEKKQLEQIGYRVRHVRSGEEAVDVIQSDGFSVDLILMDVDLGSGIDGTQAAEKIQKFRDIPVVFLSSHTEPEIVEKTEKITSYGYVVKNTGVVVLDASIKMALKLFKAKVKSKRDEEDFFSVNTTLALILDTVPQAVFWKGEDGRYLGCNSAYARIVGMNSTSHIIGKTDFDLPWPTDEAEAYREDDRTVLGTNESKLNIIEPLEQADGRRLWIKTSKLPLRDKNGRAFGVLGIFEDITERKRTEEELRTSMKKFEAFFRNSQVALFRTSITDGKLIEINLRYAQIAGYTTVEDCLKEFNAAEAWADPAARIELQTTLKKNRSVADFETEIIRRDGTHVRILFSAMIFPESGTIEGSLIDITERKRAEEELTKQLEEKGILLEEVNHRVKNNIANIEGLLLLQAGSNENPEVQFALQDAVSRVQSMRVLYDKLLLGKDYHKVSVKNYTESLINSLVAVFADSKKIAIDKHISDFAITSKRAISIGIIVNELMTNVFKYAFAGRDSGTVSISLERGGNTATLTVHDNGIGIDEKIMSNKSPGFGLNLIQMLVEQLKGSWSIKKENGTKCVVQFEI